MTGLLVPVAFLAFMALGLPDGILGVSWPAMREVFGVPLDALGLLLAVSTAGYILSSFACGALMARLGLGGLLAGSTFLAAASLAAYAASPTFPVLLGAGFAAGLGGGAVDAALNTYAAFRFPPRLLNWLHASYSLGALLGPLLMTAILSLGGTWRRGYVVVAAAQAVLGLVFVLTLRAWRAEGAGTPAPAADPPSGDAPLPGAAPAAGGEGKPAGYREVLAEPKVWLGIAAFFLYTGLEFSVGQWAYSLLVLGRGLEAAQGGLWVGLFFGGFFGGRVIAGWLPFGDRLRLLLLAGPLGLVAGALLALLGGTSPAAGAGLVLLGLACAPVYPALVAATPRRLGPRLAGHAMGMQVAAATFGIAVIPGLVGVLARRAGMEAIAWAWAATAALLLLVLLRVSRSLTDR